MKKIQIFTVFLIVQFMKSESACKIPGKIMTDIDIKKLYGTWYTHYHIPNPYEADFSCEVDEYGPSSQSDGTIVSSMYVGRFNGRTALTGTMEGQGKSNITLTFTGTRYYFNPEIDSKPGREERWREAKAQWSGVYYLMGTDYKTFLIYTSCAQNLEYPLAWILFNSKNPEQDIIDKAFEVAEQNGLKKSQFENFCEQKEHY